MTHSERVVRALSMYPGIDEYKAEMIAFDQDAEEDGVYTDVF